MPSVFLSYSREDRTWRDHLTKHLSVFEEEGLLDIWDDERIEAGADWFKEIEAAIAKASVAVLLVSADFLASKFIRREEIPRLLERRATEGLTVMPVIVRSCAWHEVGWLHKMQARPFGGQPLARLRGDRRDAELANIASEIRKVLHTRVSDQEARRDDFLSRIETLCRHHETGATVERCHSSSPAGDYLRVTRLKGPIRDVYPVGAVEYGITKERLHTFLDEIDARYRRADQGLISVLVYGGSPATPALIEEAGARRAHLISFVEYQGLIDFRTYLVKQTEKLTQDTIYPPSLFVPQRMRTLSILGREEAEKDDALAQVREWLNAPLGRFIVLLGDFGTGKTFLLHELARRMGESEGGLVPVLLQMRSLEKGRSLDELLAQHFAREGMDGFSPTKFRYMLEQGRIALLFDGFDELALRVTYAKAADHFATLLQAATGNAKVVLTSRRQHFLSESQVKTVLTERVESLTGHRLAILQPFRREQVRSFLVNFFAGNEAKAEARLDLIDHVKDLLGLSANPRLLGFIADLPEDQLVEACAELGEITAAKLYQLLLDRWLGYEFDRVHPRGAPPGLSVAERWEAVTLLALRLWQKTDRFAELSDLTEEAARIVKAVGPAAPDSEVAAFQVGSGTLLVRDDEGNFAFLHQSILEWLVAKSAAVALAAGTDPETLVARDISPLMADFFASLAGRSQAVTWARRLLSAPAREVAKKNALLVLERQKETSLKGLDLNGHDLRGKDFSGKDLSEADLSGANLTAARLVGVRLTSARLSRAILRETDLSQSLFIGADLTDADLTGARLVGADLREAKLSMTCLKRTKLLGAALDAGGLDTADALGAATDVSELSPQGGRNAEKNCCVAWSPDGELIASAEGEVIRLWEAQSGREIRALAGHRSEVRSVAFSPDGKNLATGSDDKIVQLWQVGSGKNIRAFSGHQNTILSVAFSSDGKTLASGSSDNSVRLWQINSGREIRSLEHQQAVSSIAFSPNGKILASASYDKSIRIWQVANGRQLKVITGHESRVLSISFSLSGEIIASGSSDNSVRVWQIADAREISTFKKHKSWVLSVSFSPDDKTIASASFDSSIRLWQVENGREIREFKGHKDAVRSVAFSPDGKTLASGSADKSTRHWQVDSGREISTLTGNRRSVLSVSFSPDGKALASSYDDNLIRLWQSDTGRKIGEFTGPQNSGNCIAYSPDGETLASGSEDRSVRLWHVDSGNKIGEFTEDVEIQGSVKSIAISPNGKTLVTGSDRTAVLLWQIDNSKVIGNFLGHNSSVNSLAFNPDGTILASGSADKSIRLWNVDSRKRLGVLTGHLNSVNSVSFSPDGEILASCSDDESVRLWQVESGREIRALTGHQGAVKSAAFSPDGTTLASASEDTTIRLWRLGRGREFVVFAGHQKPVLSVVFSPDGKSLASGSDDGTIRLWKVASGLCLAVLLPLPEGWVAYSPDGRYKFGGIPAGGFWHAINLCRFEIGELDELVPGLRLPDDASFFDLPPWKPALRANPTRL